jgi:hypothetical protein
MDEVPGSFGSLIGERCGRGLFGGVMLQEVMMNVEYNPDTENPLPPSSAGKSATAARQGIISGRVVTVLAVSMVLVIVALVVAYAVSWR